jgi:hypothetical protein
MKTVNASMLTLGLVSRVVINVRVGGPFMG